MAKSKCEAADEIAQFSDELADDRELLFLVFETCDGRLYSNQAHAKTRWRLPSRLRRARREAKRHVTESVGTLLPESPGGWRACWRRWVQGRGERNAPSTAAEDGEGGRRAKTRGCPDDARAGRSARQGPSVIRWEQET